MAQINHNISAPNDGLGDQLREAFGNQNTMNTELYDNKVDKAAGKDLSDNNFTDENLTKLNSLEEGAGIQIQSDWEQSDNTQKDYIKNKPLEMFSSVGSFHYVDLATQTTPLTVLAGVEKKITNDTLDPLTNVLNAPYGVTSMWDTVNNQLDFSQTSIGDLITIIPEIEITTTAANQDYKIYIKLGIGSDFPVTKQVYNGSLKTIGSIIVSPARDFTIDTLDIKDYPGEIFILSEANATVKSGTLDIKVVRKDVNIVIDHSHTNLSVLETITSTLISNWNTAYSWIVTNGTNLLNHLSNISNPHNVTKTQVGLGNVDNTSDVNKPVSAAQQTALDLKLDDTDALTAVSPTNKLITEDDIAGLGGGDMLLAGVQSVTGKKTFDNTKLAVKGSSTGVTNLETANTSATNYVATLPAKTGTIAMLDDAKTEYATLACSDEENPLTLGQRISFRQLFLYTLSEVRISSNEAPTITKLIVDVKVNGVSIFSTLVSIDTGETTSVTASVPAVISNPIIPDNAIVTVFVTQLGSGDIGDGLKISFIGQRA